MSTITEIVDVEVPVSTAYNQWTQFEEFPRFMEGVEEIRQVDATHTHWVTRFGGVTREFDATITEQHPDERVAWTSDSGPDHAGVITFHRLDDAHTRVTAQMEIDPEGFVENVADKLGVLDRRVKGDLKRFKLLLVPACTYVTEATYSKVREFVRGGGSVLMNVDSFSRDAYGKPRELTKQWKDSTYLPTLLDKGRPSEDGKGSIYCVAPSGVGDYQRLINRIADRVGVQRPVRATVGNDLNRSVELRCVKTGKGEYLLYCFNLDANSADLKLEFKSGFHVAGKDLLRGREAEGRMTLRPLEGFVM